VKSFAVFEERIDRVARQLPGMPVPQVVVHRLLFFVARNVKERQNRFLAGFGLSGSAFLALAMIFGSEGGVLNPCELSEALGASRANVSRLVDELVAAGWVKRQGSRDDGRRIVLSLTAAGRKLLGKVLPLLWQRVTSLLSVFSDREQAQFDHLLRKLLTALEGGALEAA
jgi:MarR family transcriptional repressor of emrRAB